jgi:hypothetical protein
MAKVDFTNNVDDLEAATLAATGLYSRAIGKMVGMTAGRAQYRVHRSGGSEERRAWREGTSPLFKQVMSVIKTDVQERVKQRIAAAAQKLQAKAEKAAKKKK